MSLAEQMGNTGSEVSRALKWKKKGKTEHTVNCLIRALELIDISIEAWQKDATGRGKNVLKELLRAREELCDYFLYDGATFHSDGASIMRYYDQFALMAIK